MREKFFLAYGLLIWLPVKIAAAILMALLFFANAGTMVDIDNAYTHIDPPSQQILVLVNAEPGLTEVQRGDVPDPEPPTTASNWSEMVRVAPYCPEELSTSRGRE